MSAVAINDMLRCPECGRLFARDADGCPEHPATLVPASPLLGKVIGEAYRLDERIAEGGMGEVYRASHITLPGAFAVKILSAMKAKSPALVARFLREAESQSRIQHDNCVRIIDWGEDPRHGLFYVAMEHVRGTTLSDEVRRTGPLPVARAVDIALQILDGLEAGHRAGMLHRDLKPGNIMLTEVAGRGDRVRVLDFGGKAISRTDEQGGESRARTVLTLPGALFGTPTYMSPEQARGEPLDARSDVYSAAVVLLYMLIGHVPFKGADLSDTLQRVINMPPPRPSLLREHGEAVPPGLEAALMKALAKDAANRFESARAFHDVISRYAQ